MSTKLKPLLLPQLVEERKKMDTSHIEDEFPYSSFTTNSSSSDIVSPVTPTFSTKGHFRGSSSTSSLDLSYTQFQDMPTSPVLVQPLNKKPSQRQLPDVQEEPLERDEGRILSDHDSLYSCLCDEPCDHTKSSSTSRKFSGELVTDYDFDYDMTCLSDGEYTSAPYPSKSGLDSPFLGFTARLGSRFNTINRRKSTRKTNLMSSPTTEVNFENVMSRGPSSRASSVSSPNRNRPERHPELSVLTTPATSFHGSISSRDSLSHLDEEAHDHGHLSLERERAKAITPLLPPLMTAPLARPPTDSPLQSPSIAPSSATTEMPQPTTNFSRPSLSTRPSVSSLRQTTHTADVCVGLPAILQEHDEWSDRLGHANFTITPQPYELENVDSESITKFRQDWEAARVNYTKHLVRTGENYGQTSKIYGLTEAKWAEIEGKWKAIYELAVEQATPANCNTQSYTMGARSRSRGRTRGRSGSASAAIMGRPAKDDFFAELQWQRIEDGLPSAVPRMLDADGKFPARGDEDIVGPMHRAETMERSHSEDKHGAKFWKNLAEKVGLRR